MGRDAMPAQLVEMDDERRQLGHRDRQQRHGVLQRETTTLEPLRVHGRQQYQWHDVDRHAPKYCRISRV
jgi:hypothetical protein